MAADLLWKLGDLGWPFSLPLPPTPAGKCLLGCFIPGRWGMDLKGQPLAQSLIFGPNDHRQSGGIGFTKASIY